MDYENVLLLQRHLKIFVQCIWKRWKLLTYQFKRFKIEMVKYSTSLALENEPLWIKNVLKSLLDWIDNKVTEIWQKKKKKKKISFPTVQGHLAWTGETCQNCNLGTLFVFTRQQNTTSHYLQQSYNPQWQLYVLALHW